MSERLSIDILIAERSWVFSACGVSSTRVDASLKTHAVQDRYQSADGVWGSRHVRPDLMGRVLSTVFNRPAIIDDNIVLSDIIEAFAHNLIRDLHDFVGIDVAVVCVPAVPAHGRWATGPVFMVQCRAGGGQAECKDCHWLHILQLRVYPQFAPYLKKVGM